MATATCPHKEALVIASGCEVGTCKVCGQVRRYDTQKRGSPVEVTRLGKINGAIVLPRAKDVLKLPDGEMAELKRALTEQSTGVIQPMPAVTKMPKGDNWLVPRRPKKRFKLQHYFEENKTAIIADYHRLNLREFLTRWHISPGHWKNLKHTWDMGGKRPKVTNQVITRDIIPEVIEMPVELTHLAIGSFQLNVVEQDLAGFSDAEFNRVWDSLGKIVRAKAAKPGKGGN